MGVHRLMEFLGNVVPFVDDMPKLHNTRGEENGEWFYDYRQLKDGKKKDPNGNCSQTASIAEYAYPSEWRQILPPQLSGHH